MAGDDHGHRVPAEGVADGARGAWVADALRERRVRDDLAERDARGFRQHRGLELGHPVEVQGDPKERPAAREVFAELLARLLGVAAGAWGRRAEAPPRSEARHAVVARLNAESIGERFEPWRAIPEPPKQAGERVAWRSRGREELPERQVEIHRRSPSARRRIVLPRASWLLTVLTEIPRTHGVQGAGQVQALDVARVTAAVGGRRVGRGAAPAQLVDTDVREHAVEPRGDRPARRVRRARRKRLHEGALHGVLGVRTVPEEPVGDGVEPAGVRLGHTAERALVHAVRVYARENSRGWKTISSPDRVGGRSPGSGGEPWRGALAGTS